jgi:DNA polymerase III subunit epsilon
MVREAPPASRVMAEVADFVGDYPLVAHNASFDRKFWDAELARIGRRTPQAFACSMLVSRRVLPQAPNHKLGTLVAYAGLPVTGRYHRAQADAEMAAHLTLYLERELMERFGLPAVSHELLGRIQRTAKRCVARQIAPAVGLSPITSRGLPGMVELHSTRRRGCGVAEPGVMP